MPILSYCHRRHLASCQIHPPDESTFARAPHWAFLALRGVANKKAARNESAAFCFAPPIIQSCSTTKSISEFKFP